MPSASAWTVPGGARVTPTSCSVASRRCLRIPPIVGAGCVRPWRWFASRVEGHVGVGWWGRVGVELRRLTPTADVSTGYVGAQGIWRLTVVVCSAACPPAPRRACSTTEWITNANDEHPAQGPREPATPGRTPPRTAPRGSRRRDPRAIGHATYRLVDTAGNTIVAGGFTGDGYGMDLDDVARALGEAVAAA